MCGASHSAPGAGSSSLCFDVRGQRRRGPGTSFTATDANPFKPAAGLCGLAVESSRILQHLWRQYDIKLAVKPVLLRLWPGESHWQFGPPFPRSPELTAVPRPGLVQQLLSNSAARPTYLGRGGEAHHKPCRPGHIPDQIGTCGWDPGTHIYETNNHQESRCAAESEDRRPDGVPAGHTVVTHQCQS